jgi:hypothetical protein
LKPGELQKPARPPTDRLKSLVYARHANIGDRLIYPGSLQDITNYQLHLRSGNRKWPTRQKKATINWVCATIVDQWAFFQDEATRYYGLPCNKSINAGTQESTLRITRLRGNKATETHLGWFW